MSDETKEEPERPFVVETGRRLSESSIWRLQRAFYDSAGPRAWKPKGVPSYVTNNPYIARTYARLVVAFLRDLTREGPGPAFDAREPLTIVELAAGTGRFAFLFLRA